MNPIFQQLVIQRVLKKKGRKKNGDNVSEEEIKKEVRWLKGSVLHPVKDTLLITLGILSAGFGLKGFLLPNSFIDGGVTGISLLVNEVTGAPLATLIVLINAPFIVLGFTQVGKSFATKSVLSISGLAVAITFIDYPVITTDKLLVAVFGGFFLGAGIGLTIRGGAVLDGTELLAIYLSKKTGLTVGDIILIFNILIFSVAAWLLTIVVALYSVLIYVVASKTVDFFIVGVEEYIGVTIVSQYSEQIRVLVTEQLGRGVTVYNGKGGYGKHGRNLNNVDILYTVITRLEIARLQAEVEKIDPEAFMVMSSIKDTKGGMIKKRPLH